MFIQKVHTNFSRQSKHHFVKRVIMFDGTGSTELIRQTEVKVRKDEQIFLFLCSSFLWVHPFVVLLSTIFSLRTLVCRFLSVLVHNTSTFFPPQIKNQDDSGNGERIGLLPRKTGLRCIMVWNVSTSFKIFNTQIQHKN